MTCADQIAMVLLGLITAPMLCALGYVSDRESAERAARRDVAVKKARESCENSRANCEKCGYGEDAV